MSERETEPGLVPISPADGPVLVTGATGFIGSHAVERLAAAGLSVRCFLRPGSPAPCIGEPFRGDVRDGASVRAAMAGVRIVVHLAGLAGPAASLAAPHEAFLANTLGTQHVLEAARVCGVARVVLLSTAHVFGPARLLPVTETHPLAPASPYAASKLAADVLAQGYRRSFGLAAAILRPFNVYGPRQGTAAVIPTIIRQVLAGQPVRLRSLTPRRDFVYVDDLVEALIRAAVVQPVPEQPLIVASGQAVSVRELARRVLAIAGAEAAQIPEDHACDATDCLYGDPTEAWARLGWSARMDLDEGLARTIHWWRARPRTHANPRQAVLRRQA